MRRSFRRTDTCTSIIYWTTMLALCIRIVVMTSLIFENGSNPMNSDLHWIALHSTSVAKRVSNIYKFNKKNRFSRTKISKIYVVRAAIDIQTFRSRRNFPNDLTILFLYKLNKRVFHRKKTIISICFIDIFQHKIDFKMQIYIGCLSNIFLQAVCRCR